MGPLIRLLAAQLPARQARSLLAGFARAALDRHDQRSFLMCDGKLISHGTSAELGTLDVRAIVEDQRWLRLGWN